VGPIRQSRIPPCRKSIFYRLEGPNRQPGGTVDLPDPISGSSGAHLACPFNRPGFRPSVGDKAMNQTTPPSLLIHSSRFAHQHRHKNRERERESFRESRVVLREREKVAGPAELGRRLLDFTSRTLARIGVHRRQLAHPGELAEPTKPASRVVAVLAM
jgi:hypothetical protein